MAKPLTVQAEEYTITLDHQSVTVLVDGSYDYAYDELSYFSPVPALIRRAAALEAVLGRLLQATLQCEAPPGLRPKVLDAVEAARQALNQGEQNG